MHIMDTKKYEVLEDLSAESLCGKLNLVDPDADHHPNNKAIATTSWELPEDPTQKYDPVI